jgi:hypothetical protein
MAEYRLYFLNAHGRIESRTEFLVSTDEEAVAVAISKYSASDWELWAGSRCVRKFIRSALSRYQATAIGGDPAPVPDPTASDITG